MASMRRTSCSLSALISRMSAAIASRSSASDLPTPAKTIFFGGAPTRRARKSSPPLTTSNPEPSPSISFMIERFEFALTE